MAAPNPYARTYGFENYQSLHPSDPLPGDQLDAQLDAVEAADASMASAVRDIRRSDGALNNGIVTPDSLASATLALVSAAGIAPRGAWVTLTAYATKDIVTQSGVTYICVTAHTSGTFSTDLAAGKWLIFSQGAQAVATYTAVLAAGAGTYNTPTNCRQLIVRLKAPGGGGSGTGTAGAGNGSDGSDSSFNSVVAKGGQGGNGTSVGPGDGGHSGSGSAQLRLPGMPGSPAALQVFSASDFLYGGGNGGGRGGGKGPITATAGADGAANSGGGGSGGAVPHAAQSSVFNSNTGAGGGEGEEITIVINSPAATYSYLLGAKGVKGAAGTSGLAGGDGALGFLWVEERY